MRVHYLSLLMKTVRSMSPVHRQKPPLLFKHFILVTYLHGGVIPYCLLVLK